MSQATAQVGSGRPAGSGAATQQDQATMALTVKVWRQAGPEAPGQLVAYSVAGLTPDMSFLEMLDVLNEDLQRQGLDPVAFDSDCREGICGMCGLVIDGLAHGPGSGATTCQLYMRRFQDGDTITVEPFRARAFPVVKDLIVDRSAFDRIVQAGGYTSVNAGSAQDGNSLLISKDLSEEAMDAAACVGCGACVASCKNASAMLFVAAKVKHLNILPQGQPERTERSTALVARMQEEGFGHCTNEYECEAVCPKEISADSIAFLNREYARAKLKKTALGRLLGE